MSQFLYLQTFEFAQMVEPKSTYLPAFTGLRAVAAFLVFCFHYNPFDPTGWLGFVNEWHVGVSIFFVLSGFLITLRYFDSGPIHLKRYFLNRFARIYPLYFLLTVITFVISFKQYDSQYFTELILNLFLVKALFYKLTFSGINQAWSLTAEEFFYVLAPLLYFFVRRSWVWLIVFPILFLVFGFLLVQVFGENSFQGFFENAKFMFLYTFFGRSTEFAVGISIGLLIQKWKVKNRFPFFTTAGFFAIGLIIGVLSLIKGNAQYGIYTYRGIFLNNFVLPVFGISLLFIGLIYEESQLKKILSTRLFRVLGKSSYAFYLIHMGFVADFLGQQLGFNSILKFFGLNVLAILIFKYIEEPVSHWLKTHFAPKKQS